ncbi:unnamed protein product [Symbiodinium sp. CCMP2592]|nr:unnamed protein product [Symbiodinium sp. CCMP2592]
MVDGEAMEDGDRSETSWKSDDAPQRAEASQRPPPDPWDTNDPWAASLPQRPTPQHAGQQNTAPASAFEAPPQQAAATQSGPPPDPWDVPNNDPWAASSLPTPAHAGQPSRAAATQPAEHPSRVHADMWAQGRQQASRPGPTSQVRLNGGTHAYAQQGPQSAGHYAASPQEDPWADGNDPWSQSMPQQSTQIRQQPYYPPSTPHAAPYRPPEGPPGAPYAPQFTPKPAPAAAPAYNGVGKGFGKQVPPAGAPPGPIPQGPPQRAPDPSKGSGKTAPVGADPRYTPTFGSVSSVPKPKPAPPPVPDSDDEDTPQPKASGQKGMGKGVYLNGSSSAHVPAGAPPVGRPRSSPDGRAEFLGHFGGAGKVLSPLTMEVRKKYDVEGAQFLQWDSDQPLLLCNAKDGLAFLRPHHPDHPGGWLPVETLAAEPVYDFMVRVRVADGVTIGLQCQQHKLADDVEGLLVTSVEEGGVLERWNELCLKGFPRDQLLPGDLIIGVGESYSSATIDALYQDEAMLAMGILQLHVVRFAATWIFGESGELRNVLPWQRRSVHVASPAPRGTTPPARFSEIDQFQ